VSKELLENSYLYGTNAGFIEELYQKFLQDSNSVSPEWQAFFINNQASDIRPSWQKKHQGIIEQPVKQVTAKPADAPNNGLEHLRKYGHLATNIDPLNLEKPKSLAELGIDPSAPNLEIYTGTVGAEFSHVASQQEQAWLYERFEQLHAMQFSKEEKIQMLQDLVEVEGLEQYLHKKFPGEKRFSVEGGDSSMVALRRAIDEAAKYSVNEVVVGMAHRGRLNTLTKVLGKPYEALFAEFFGKSAFPEEFKVAGDVKYHMSFSNDITTEAGHKVHLTLTPNPSHLEAVNPVVAGRVRAKQDIKKDTDRSKVLGLLFHGDAAFCGQGVVAESLTLSTLDAYETGGIFHVVINNQVGFTANPHDGHAASRYSTEFAKVIGAPILHVNGDDVEGVVKATILASEYRARFKKDPVVEIICYRKYGHNEGDEPMYTQPLMYDVVKAKQTPAAIYANKLVASSVIAADGYQQMTDKFKERLDKAFAIAKDFKPNAYFLDGDWNGYSKDLTESDKRLTTGVAKKDLENLLETLCKVPTNFTINPKLLKLYEQRKDDLISKKRLDWATGEQLAFASLLESGIPVRLTGQDAGRGTFSHRHSVWYDQKTGEKYLPLNNISKTQSPYEVADSNLSEYAVLGYEFGYSMSHPKSLVIWEAQYGDFSNGAQIMFDQFLSTTETKWLRLSGLVLLLPHSYEGQGPEHTSARLERMLQLCADNNMQVCYPTTPASIFHLMRRQQLRQVRKPLIIMSPKSILRNPLAVSSIDEIATGTNFKPLIEDDLDHKIIKKVVICSGKVYYDLLDSRTKSNINNVAIIRIEQLYPFPVDELNKELAKYKNAELIWCQEEPENMGAWSYIYSRIVKELARGSEIKYVGRKESASPCTGYSSVHAVEQKNLIETALKI